MNLMHNLMISFRQGAALWNDMGTAKLGSIVLLFLAGVAIVKFPIYANPYKYFYFYEISLLFLSAQLRSRHLFYLSVGLAVLFSGFRYEVGVDYESYNNLFDEIGSGSQLSLSEPFTWLIVTSVKYIGLGHEYIFLIYSVVTILGIVKLINLFPGVRHQSFFIFLAVPILYLSSMNGIRQWAAIGLSGYVLSYLIERRPAKMYLAIVIAIGFHLSATILFSYIFLKRRYGVYALLFVSVLSVVFSDLVSIVISYTPYSIYVADGGLRFEGGSYGALLLYCVLISYMTLRFGYFDSKQKISDGVVVLCNLNILSVLWIVSSLILGIDFLTLMRLNAYFTVQLIVLLPLLATTFRGQVRGWGRIALLLLATFYLTYTLTFNGELYKLVPYRSAILSGI